MSEQKSHFAFTSYQADIPGGSVRFHFELSHNGTIHEFTETLEFTPPEGYKNSKTIDLSLKAILDSLHILLGISYWKLTCAKDIRLPLQSLDQKQADFWNTVYTKGLGEFFYKNSIDFRGLVAFPFIQKHVGPTPSHVRKDRSLVLLGSGKDSITTSELLKKAKKTFSLFSLSPRPIHRETAQLIQASLYEVKRTIDPKLFELNKVAGMYNGHIPITAITSLTAILMAHLNDFRYVILSNEESANYGNVEYHGSMINHQWSKSLEFETLFREYLRNYVTSDIVYFSLLRGFTEFHIVKLFVTHPRYFNVFTSCNENFGVLKDRPTTLWCGNCPKCAFVFLMLAAYLPKKQLISIFQKNLFADAKLLPTYKELLALEGIKPFECVGTPEESLAAFEEVLKKGEYAADFVIQSIAPSVESMLKEKNVSTESVFVFSNNHNIPDEFVDLVSNI